MNRNITALILIVLAAGTYFTYTKGILEAAAGVKKINDQYSSAIASATKLINVRDKVLQDYNHIDPLDVARLDKMIPSTVDNIRFVIDMSNMARKDNITLRNIKAVASQNSTAKVANSPRALRGGGDTASVIAAPTLDTVSVSFSLSATYEQFQTFLRDLEANLRVMDLTHLTVSASDSGTYDFSVELKTYWLRQ
jgi:Tfp pilus assembly protein PilO